MKNRSRVRPENRLCTGHRAGRPEPVTCSICGEEKHVIEMVRYKDVCWECYFHEESETEPEPKIEPEV